MDILIPTLILLGVGIACSVVLTLAEAFFGVKENETAAAIRDCLPGVNCGTCGYSGCDAYAKALAEKNGVATNLCTPGGDRSAKQIAAILGVEGEQVVEQVAYVACNGNCDAVQKKYNYQGQKTCHALNSTYQGDKLCPNACLGCGDCAAVCPQKAISVNNGVAKINYSKCIGCGVCMRECPKGIIHLTNDTARVVMKCSNREKGAQTRKSCTNGCIACMKCQKVCPNGAIKVTNNLAVIDYTLCNGCGECAKACPVHCIYEGSFICGSH